jgi:hypothetical protein
MEIFRKIFQVAAERAVPEAKQVVSDAAMQLHQKEQKALSDALHALEDPANPVNNIIVRRGVPGAPTGDPPDLRSVLIDDPRISREAQIGIRLLERDGQTYYHVLPNPKATNRTWLMPTGRELPRDGWPSERGESVLLPNGIEYEMIPRAAK